MEHSRAAQIWSAIEHTLIERGWLSDGRRLDLARADLIRLVGDMVDAPAFARRVVEDAGHIPAAHVGKDRRGARDVAVRQNKPRVKVRRVDDQHIVRVREHWHDSKHWDDTVVDAKLAAMLEWSCSRRVGYDGDDDVGYER